MHVERLSTLIFEWKELYFCVAFIQDLRFLIWQSNLLSKAFRSLFKIISN